jgi:type IV pilus assembly protein PilB
MIGEVRDSNTAKSLFDTAKTGHLLLSTMHADNTTGATTRLASLGVEGSVMNDSLLGICSQILIRKNCPDCITTRTMTEDEINYFFMPKSGNDSEYEKFRSMNLIPVVAESTGFVNGDICPKCEGTSFYGRAPVVEIYVHNKYDEKHAKIIADICKNDPLAPIRMNELFRNGEHEPFALNALKHMFYHTTSPQEVMRHLPPSMFTEYKSLLIKKTNEIIEAAKK